MKRVLVIFLLGVYMISTTELSQLLKFPVLVEHYFQHKDKSPELSIIDFLRLHYDNHLMGHPHNEDYDQDLKLPFISNTVLLLFSFVIAPSYFFEGRNLPHSRHLQKVLPHDDVFVKTHILSSIWHPPKYC